MIRFQNTKDFARAAKLTYANMRSYYETHGVDWSATEIEGLTQALINLDIMLDNEWVGVLRLSFTDNICHIRDVQIVAKFQSQGIGGQALAEAERLAILAKTHALQLKVFKVSPAVQLYERKGFVTYEEDERFYYMERKL